LNVELGEEDVFEFKYSGTPKSQGGGGFGQQNMPQLSGTEPQNIGEEGKSWASPPKHPVGYEEYELEKSRVYINHPNQAPKGSKIQRSPRGKLYYESERQIQPQRPNEQTLEMDKRRRIETLLNHTNEHYDNLLEEYKHSKDINPGHAMSLEQDLTQTRNLIRDLQLNYNDLIGNPKKMEKESEGRNININIHKETDEIVKYLGEQEDIYNIKKFKEDLNKIFNEEMSKVISNTDKFSGDDIKIFTKKCLDDAIYKMNIHTKRFIQKAYASGQEYVGNLVKQSIDFSKIDQNALDAILKRHILWESYENLAKSTSEQINQIITETYSDPKTFSIHNLVEKMSEVADSETYRLERIARTETHHAAMKGREISFQKTDPDGKNLYKWGVRHDSRTSDQCKEIESIIEKEGNGKGVSLSRLNEILKEISLKYGGKNWQYRDWVVHPSCRSGLIRSF